jgi:hypothetical protein
MSDFLEQSLKKIDFSARCYEKYFRNETRIAFKRKKRKMKRKKKKKIKFLQLKQ